MTYYENKNKTTITLIPNEPEEMKSLVLGLYMISALFITLGGGGGVILALSNSPIFSTKLSFILSISFSTGIGIALLVYQRSFRNWVQNVLFDQKIIEFTNDAILFKNYDDFSLKRKVSISDVKNFDVYEKNVINPTITTFNFPRKPRFNKFSKTRAIELMINYLNDEKNPDKINLDEYGQSIQIQKKLIKKIFDFAKRHYINLKLPENIQDQNTSASTSTVA
ncbi:MAG: hypothetical protein ACFE95_09320 [Candidatus Hodarchaeota archaeon]